MHNLKMCKFFVVVFFLKMFSRVLNSLIQYVLMFTLSLSLSLSLSLPLSHSCIMSSFHFSVSFIFFPIPTNDDNLKQNLMLIEMNLKIEYVLLFQ